MFKTTNDTTIYMYSISSGGYSKKFADEAELIAFLAHSRYIDDCDVNYTWKDKYFVPDEWRAAYIGHFYLRDTVFIRSDWSIVDIRQFRDAVANYSEPAKQYGEPEYGDRLTYDGHRHHANITVYRYRMDPVPGTGRRGGIHNCLRHPHTTGELRDIANPENKGMFRPKRKNIPTTWDDLWRPRTRSWKEQSKRRHQWR